MTRTKENIISNFVVRISVLLLSTVTIISPVSSDFLFRTQGCGETKGCLFKPQNCIPYNDCSYAFSYVRDSSHVFMELFATLPLYQGEKGGFVAVGFSKDDLMGSDTVTDCSSFSGRPFVGRLSFNPGKSNRRVPINEVDVHNSMLQTLISHYANGTLYCKLAQSIHPAPDVKHYHVQPLDIDHWILMASGPTDGEELEIHTLDDTSDRFPFNSQGPISLVDFVSKNEADLLNETSIYMINITDTNMSKNNSAQGSLIKKDRLRIWDMLGPGENKLHDTDRKTRTTLTTAHSLLMIISWIVLVPMAILVARYTRPNWPEKRMLGASLWLNVHRTLNLLAVLFTAISIFCIFYAHGFHWHGIEAFNTHEWGDIHGLIGFIACWFVWFQLFNSIFRCQPGSRFRPIHNFLHRTCGLTAWILGTTALGIAFWHLPRFMNANLARIVFIVYLVVITGSLSMLEPLKWRIWCQRRGQVVAPASPNWEEDGRRAPKPMIAQQRAQQFALQRQQEQRVQKFQTITVTGCALIAVISTLLFMVLIVFRDY
ncbi:Ferric-chelate reductase 1 [Aphelenchoides besseyi]|nr:Ferric-chelate reductase 1 [Aphelenchoides besseyi]